MKSIMLIFLCLCSLISQGQQKEYFIDGQIGNTTDGVVYLVKPMEQVVLDSTEVKAGKFQFKGAIASTAPVILAFNHKHGGFRESKDTRHLFIEPGRIKVKGTASLRKAEVSGTATNDDVITLSKVSNTDSIDHEIARLIKTSGTDEQRSEAYRQRLTALHDLKMDKLKKSYVRFIRSHTGSLISLRSLNDLAGEEEYDVVNPLFIGLSEQLKNSEEGKMLALRLQTLQKVALGAVLPDISFPDTNGKMVSISSFRGKYILVDFWASWCGPCRQDNPNLVATYNGYKNKNFTIVGVSLDQDKAKWLEAIQKDGLAWAQLSDLKLWDSAAVKAFGINSIPQNYLLNPDGVIIAKNLSGENLKTKLKEVLN